MAHGLILGPTECGKTTLAKLLIRGARRRGRHALVCDPSGRHWEADFVTRDIDEYLRVVFSNRDCLLVIDEAGEAIGSARSAATEGRLALATRSRHEGHSALFLAQRATLISPSVRSQCQRAWIFRQHYSELQTLARDLCRSEIMSASDLQRGHCLYVDIYQGVREIDVFALAGFRKSAHSENAV